MHFAKFLKEVVLVEKFLRKVFDEIIRMTCNSTFWKFED